MLRPLYRRVSGHFYRMFAEGLIISKLRYYLPVLAAESPKTLKPLETAYRQCLRLICGGIRSTPIPLLYSQSGFPPLSEMIADACRKQLIRITERPGSRMGQEFFSAPIVRGSPYDGMALAYSQRPPWMLARPFETRSQLTEQDLDTMYKTKFVILPTITVARGYLKTKSLIPSADLYLYTDGSYRPPGRNRTESSGAGIAILDSDGVRILYLDCRNVVPPCHAYYGEVEAMILGLEKVLERHCRGGRRTKLCILSDSQSLLRHLEALRRRLRASVPESTKTLIRLLHEVSKFHQVQFIWIPGHEGIWGNELADQKAKEGLDSTVEMGHSYPISTFRLWARRETETNLEEFLKDTITESKVNPSAPPRTPFEEPRMSPPITKSMSRQVEVTLFRLFSGHANTRAHWSRLGLKVEDTQCRYCHDALETSEHLMTTCKRLWNRDRSVLNNLRQVQDDHLGGDKSFRTMLGVRQGPVYDAVLAVVEKLVERGVRL